MATSSKRRKASSRKKANPDPTAVAPKVKEHVVKKRPLTREDIIPESDDAEKQRRFGPKVTDRGDEVVPVATEDRLSVEKPGGCTVGGQADFDAHGKRTPFHPA